MKREIDVADISVVQYIDFLNGIHGKSRLDKYEVLKNSVHIVRSSLHVDYEMRRVYNEYVFQDKDGDNGYCVRWLDEDGVVHDISEKFEKYMTPITESVHNDKLDKIKTIDMRRQMDAQEESQM